MVHYSIISNLTFSYTLRYLDLNDESLRTSKNPEHNTSCTFCTFILNKVNFKTRKIVYY